jgi:hypothetical protein
VEPDGWLGFAGVVLGALLGYGSSMVQETMRRRHEDDRAVRARAVADRQRLQDLRFNAYVAMITEANRVYAVIKHPADGRVDVSRVQAAYESFLVSISPAFMVAADAPSRDVIAALARVVRQLCAAVIDGDEGDAPSEGADDPESSVPELLRAHRSCVRQAEAVMRAELGIIDT